jgi:hypothetical protein
MEKGFTHVFKVGRSAIQEHLQFRSRYAFDDEAIVGRSGKTGSL